MKKLIKKIKSYFVHKEEIFINKIAYRVEENLMGSLFTRRGIDFYQRIINESKKLGAGENYKSLIEMYLNDESKRKDELYKKYYEEIAISEKYKNENLMIKQFCKGVLNFVINSKDKQLIQELNRLNEIYNIFSIEEEKNIKYITWKYEKTN